MPQGRKHSSYMETFAMPKTGILARVRNGILFTKLF